MAAGPRAFRLAFDRMRIDQADLVSEMIDQPSSRSPISEEIYSSLSFAGVDILLTRDREFKIIEVNDHPVALSRSRDLYKAGSGVFGPDPFRSIAAALASRADGGPIVLLLPQSFKIGDLGPIRGPVGLKNDLEFDDSRVESTLSDFNCLAEAIMETGHDVRISDAARLDVSGGELYLDGGERVGSLFRRHSKFPKTMVRCFCMNDLRQRVLCGDKLATCGELTRRLGKSSVIATYVFDRNEETLAFLEERCGTPGADVIVKPRWGSASVGIRRLKAREALKHLENTRNERVDGAFICQPWIEPAVVHAHGNGYYYDLRLYVVAGEVVSGFARRSAAPNIGLAGDSPLSWLTTTGPCLPICDLAGAESAGWETPPVRMSAEAIEEMNSLAARASRALNEAGASLDFERAVATIPAFHLLANMASNFDPLEVVGRPAPHRF